MYYLRHQFYIMPKKVSKPKKITNEISVIIPTKTIDDCKTKIKKIASKCKNFKIGESGQILSERFSNSADYPNTYNDISSIYKSKNKILIDNLEVKLITYAKRYYVVKCDNIDDRSYGRMTDKNGFYSVYIVYK